MPGAVRPKQKAESNGSLRSIGGSCDIRERGATQSLQMKIHSTILFRFVLPLPRFIFHPLSTAFIAAVHVYLAAGHLSKVMAGPVEWTDLWKGLGALGGAYVFAALASRSMSARLRHHAGTTDGIDRSRPVSMPARQAGTDASSEDVLH